MKKIKLIVGLGNPGKEYENTRHNIGFVFVSELARHLNAPDFEFNKNLSSAISEIKHKIIMAKPQTFMNKSGIAVSSLSKFYRIKPQDTLIIHDDIDISWGDFKFSFGRNSAGHKGVESIIKSLKTKNFWRLRIGIQPVRQAQGKPALKKRIPAEKIILKKFTPKELREINKTIKNAISELEIA